MAATTTSSLGSGDGTNGATDSVAPNSSSSAANGAATRTTYRRLRPYRPPTDDEILGLPAAESAPSRLAQVFRPEGSADADVAKTLTSKEVSYMDSERAARDSARNDNETTAAGGTSAEPEKLRAAFDANPELRQVWHDAHSYRESFATPEEARAATALLADVDRMDALFFSRRPEDHAELARAVAALDPAAFASLAQAMSQFATETQNHEASGKGLAGSRYTVPAENGARDAEGHSERSGRASLTRPGEARVAGHAAEESLFGAKSQEGPARRDASTPSRAFSAANENQIARDSAQQHVGATTAQIAFLHSANAAAVRNVVDAIETQVERLLPEGASKTARNRVVGEIYRELDTTLRSNRQLSQQMRDAFRSGQLDADHERALVSLVTSRARQALPGVAKRVMNEWTSTIVAANHDRRARQRAAESRVDIAGSARAGNDGIRPMTPRDIDYARLSDSDILNL